MKDGTILVESVRKLLRRGATVHLLNMLVKIRPADPAEAFESLDEEDRSAVFRFKEIRIALLGLPAFFGVAGPHLVAQ